MKNLTFLILTAHFFTLFGCGSDHENIQDVLSKNPQIVFDVIEENPEKFVETVNHAVKKAQYQQYEKRHAEIRKEQERDLLSPKNPQLSDEKRLLGNKSDKIVIVEYADFQCPACKVAFESLEKFKEKHKNNIQFFYKNVPLDFHKMAYPAALYLAAIRKQDPAKAYGFYKYVFENQGLLTSDGFLDKAARHVKADMAKLDLDIKSDSIKQSIKEDLEEFESFGFTGTPVIIINGVALHGAPSLEELERVTQLTIAAKK